MAAIEIKTNGLLLTFKGRVKEDVRGKIRKDAFII